MQAQAGWFACTIVAVHEPTNVPGHKSMNDNDNGRWNYIQSMCTSCMYRYGYGRLAQLQILIYFSNVHTSSRAYVAFHHERDAISTVCTRNRCVPLKRWHRACGAKLSVNMVLDGDGDDEIRGRTFDKSGRRNDEWRTVNIGGAGHKWKYTTVENYSN